MDKSAILTTAIRISHEAGSIIRAGFGKCHNITLKGSVNPVTEIDLASESLIVEQLQSTFPGHLIHAEEGSGEHTWRTDAPIWLIDPLDGTNNFAHGFPHVCVSMALVIAGQPQIGVIYDPLRNETFAAAQGMGATRNGTTIRVSTVPTLESALLTTGFPYDRRTLADNNTQQLDNFLRRSQGVRRVGAAALDLAYVASGIFDGYWEFNLKPWDLAAGILLVTEAGGRVSDFSGDVTPGLLSGAELLASNGLIHAEMLRVLRDGAGAPHPDWPELS
ncbi:MAG: inositol monophosphatase [Anaerolineae bacterium]|nr:inositol monophosphatase [Anaerolineae bacterium]